MSYRVNSFFAIPFLSLLLLLQEGSNCLGRCHVQESSTCLGRCQVEEITIGSTSRETRGKRRKYQTVLVLRTGKLNMCWYKKEE